MRYGRYGWLMIAAVLSLFPGCPEGRQTNKTSLPVPAIEEVVPKPATGHPAWRFSGQNASRWRRISGQDIPLPEGLPLDSLWRRVVDRGDSVWVLQQIRTFSDTILFPPLDRDSGSFCVDVVEIPLLLFPDAFPSVDTPPVHIALQARTRKDTVWRTLTRWPWLVVWNPDSFQKCPQEMVVSVGGTPVPIGWGGRSCFGELDPPGPGRVTVRMVVSGGDPGTRWTLGLLTPGWRRRGPGEDRWRGWWEDLRQEIRARVEGIPCRGELHVRAQVLRNHQVLMDSLEILRFLPWGALPKLPPTPFRFGSGRFHAPGAYEARLWVNGVLQAETTWQVTAPTPVSIRDTLWWTATTPRDTAPVFLPLQILPHGMVGTVYRPGGEALVYIPWGGHPETLRVRSAFSAPGWVLDGETRSYLLFHQPITGSTHRLWVENLEGDTLDLDTLSLGTRALLEVVDWPEPRAWALVLQTLQSDDVAAQEIRDFGVQVIRWTGDRLAYAPFRVFLRREIPYAEIPGPEMKAVAFGDTALTSWMVLWDHRDHATLEVMSRGVSQTYASLPFVNIAMDVDQQRGIGQWIQRRSDALVHGVLRFSWP